MNLHTIALVGKGGGRIAELVDLALIVHEEDPARIQEIHVVVGNILCSMIEEELFGESADGAAKLESR